jgi:hypothetical protein
MIIYLHARFLLRSWHTCIQAQRIPAVDYDPIPSVTERILWVT